MAEPLKDDFRSGAPISQVPASWFNRIAKFFNTIKAGFGLKWTKSEDGANVIDLDIETGTPSTDTYVVDVPCAPSVKGTQPTVSKFSWVASRTGNGLVIKLPFAMQSDSGGINQYVREVTFTYSRAGTLVSAVATDKVFDMYD